MSFGLLTSKEDVTIPYALSFQSFIHSTSHKDFETGRDSNPKDFAAVREDFEMERSSMQNSNLEMERNPRSMNFSAGRRDFEMGRSSMQNSNLEMGRNPRSMNFSAGQRDFEMERGPRPDFYAGGRNSRPMDFVRGVIGQEGSRFPQYHVELNDDFVFMKLKRNNTFVAVTDSKGNKKKNASMTAGWLQKLQGGAKLSRYAAEATAEHVGQAARQLGLKSFVMRVNGFTYFKKKRLAITSFAEGYAMKNLKRGGLACLFVVVSICFSIYPPGFPPFQGSFQAYAQEAGFFGEVFHVPEAFDPDYEEMESFQRSEDERAIAVEDFVKNLISKYPYWNRTLGADHFFVTCADINDVSLPQRVPPLALPPAANNITNRITLAFWRGLNNSDIRQKLLEAWENDLELFIQRGRDPGIEDGDLVYHEAFNNSKYCICPGGPELDRTIALAIHYGCVPVIMSDYYDLPFKDILDWRKFSIILEESQVYYLREHLEEMLEHEYRAMKTNTVMVIFFFFSSIVCEIFS
ncbi:hypothetical protein NC652_019621 [Populus alba x Populus x berolinensis]|nr:hypothetical protein NC652_019621 [Populus alba x Populus x berolinensis]